MVMSILLSVLSFVTFRILQTERTNRKPGYLTLTLLLIPGALFFALYHIIFSHLIFNSNINFGTFKVLDLNIFSLTGFISVILLFGIPFLYTLKIFQIIKQPDVKKVILSVTTAMALFPVLFFRDVQGLVTIALFYFLMTILIWLLLRINTAVFNKTVIFSAVLGLYSLVLITTLSEKKTEENV